MWVVSLAQVAPAATSQSYSLLGPMAGVGAVTLIYLLIDVYMSTKTFRGIVGSGAFWLLYLVFCLLGLIAFGVLQVAARDKIVAAVGQADLATLLQTILAVFGATTVIQSFAIKVGDFKMVDVGQFVDQFRNQVKAAITDRAAKIGSRKNLKLIEMLAKKYKNSPQELLGPLNTTLTKIDPDGAAQVLAAIQKRCAEGGIDISRGYAEKLVVMDADYAAMLKK